MVGEKDMDWKNEGRMKAQGKRGGSGVREQQGLVFLEKPFCFWQSLCWEILEHQEIVLRVLCKPTDTA